MLIAPNICWSMVLFSQLVLVLSRQDERNPLAASTDEDDDTGASLPPSGEEKAKRTYAPRRKFQWNDNLRFAFFNVPSIVRSL